MLLKKTFVFIIICILYRVSSGAGILVDANEVLLGIKGGRSTVIGHYQDSFEDPFFIGLYSLYPLSVINQALFFAIDLDYTHYPLEKSNSSEVTVTSLGLGLLYCYPLYRYVQPYAAFDSSFNYLKLTTENTNTIEKTYKMGARLKTGMFIPFGTRIRARFGVEYLLTELSHENFERVNYTIGISYNIALYEKIKTKKARQFVEANRYYQLGVQHMEAGKIEQAKIYFQKVLSIDASHHNADARLKQIEQAENTYNKAVLLIKKGNIYEAIPQLEKSAEVLPEARDSLEKIRIDLSVKVKELEQKGVAAYEHKEYKQCIKIMYQIQLIDPENKMVEIYLPRAKKRYEALQRLE